MLKTGNKHIHKYSWYENGINQSLYGYSANNHNHTQPIPQNDLDWFFDAIFARAIYKSPNKPLEAWRQEERISPTKHRMLKFKNSTSPHKLIRQIYDKRGMSLKKEFVHPEFLERTEARILDVQIFTVGNGWIVNYCFSFKEFDYEPGWTQGYIQKEDESISEFLERSYKSLCNMEGNTTSMLLKSLRTLVQLDILMGKDNNLVKKGENHGKS